MGKTGEIVGGMALGAAAASAIVLGVVVGSTRYKRNKLIELYTKNLNTPDFSASGKLIAQRYLDSLGKMTWMEIRDSYMFVFKYVYKNKQAPQNLTNRVLILEKKYNIPNA